MIVNIKFKRIFNFIRFCSWRDLNDETHVLDKYVFFDSKLQCLAPRFDNKGPSFAKK